MQIQLSMKRFDFRLFVVVAVFVLLCAACSKSREPAPPTSIPFPTFTSTPEPTSIPEPTSTPSLEDDSIYRDGVQRIIGDETLDYSVASSWITIGEKFDLLSEDATLIANELWQIEIAIAVASLQTAYSNAQDLQPPAHLKTFHNIFIEGLYNCDLASQEIVRGVDELNTDYLLSASTFIRLCVETLKLAYTDPNW